MHRASAATVVQSSMIVLILHAGGAISHGGTSSITPRNLKCKRVQLRRAHEHARTRPPSQYNQLLCIILNHKKFFHAPVWVDFRRRHEYPPASGMISPDSLYLTFAQREQS
jgi:hypothetical protein